MKRQIFRSVCMIMLLCALALTVISCGQPAASTGPSDQQASGTTAGTQAAASDTAAVKPIKIGLSMATLQEEKWKRIEDSISEKAKKVGAEVLVQSANGDENLQVSQCDNLITQGINVLIVVAQNGDAAAPIVESAHKSGVKVIAYDRLISNCDLDFYISFDCKVVGEIQAKSAVAKAPKGNYMLVSGSPTDNNAHLMRDGQMEILKPYIDRGDIKIVVDQWCKGWNPEEALKYTENGLTANKNDIQCVLTSNDGTAGGAIQALAEQGLAGKVVVTGLDTDLAACQRIVEGTQTMTIYRPFYNMDQTTVNLATAIAKGQPVDGSVTSEKISTVNNGQKDVQSILLTSDKDIIPVDASNMSIVIKDEWLKLEDIYKDIPKDKWPKE